MSDDFEKETYIAAPLLKDFVTTILQAVDLSRADAQTVAWALVEANLEGIDTHRCISSIANLYKNTPSLSPSISHLKLRCQLFVSNSHTWYPLRKADYQPLAELRLNCTQQYLLALALHGGQ